MISAFLIFFDLIHITETLACEYGSHQHITAKVTARSSVFNNFKSSIAPTDWFFNLNWVCSINQNAKCVSGVSTQSLCFSQCNQWLDANSANALAKTLYLTFLNICPIKYFACSLHLRNHFVVTVKKIDPVTRFWLANVEMLNLPQNF